jgi:spermidine/putrescine transport system ATP-binding protein
MDSGIVEVEIQSVTKRFGAVAAVESISLSVCPGEFLTLLGPSGCGKTTLLRLIAGFETPDEGRIILNGLDVTDLPPYRRDVTTVFQHYVLFPHLDVHRNIMFGLERKRVPREAARKRVLECLELVKLTGLESRRPDELSGGQQQRVALARALAPRPRVLLLDEPLAALDLKLRKQMQIELRELQRELGISFVYVTHDQEEAITMSDRVAVMNSGRIEQVGAPRDVYERPRTEFVAGFIGSSNILDATVLRAIADGAVIDLGGIEVESSQQANPGEKVRVLIRPERITLREVPSEKQPDLPRGTVESVVYLGPRTELRIRLAGGQLITVVNQNSVPPEPGRTAYLEIDPDSIIVLSNERRRL